MHSDAICIDVLEVGSAEKMLIARTLNSAYSRNLQRCFLKFENFSIFDVRDSTTAILVEI